MKHLGIEFKETMIPLYQDNHKDKILAYSPSGKVPALKHGEITVWDSLAICEYLAETFPQAKLWPQDSSERAYARSICAEMHSGFLELRKNMPMNLRRSYPGKGRTPEAEADISRITEIWNHCRQHFGKKGAFLFGDFTIADVMFAPVVTRFQTYAVPLPALCQQYANTILALPSIREWTLAAKQETHVLPAFEV